MADSENPAQTPAAMPPTATASASEVRLSPSADKPWLTARQSRPKSTLSTNLGVPAKPALSQTTKRGSEANLSDAMQRWLREGKKDAPWSGI